MIEIKAEVAVVGAGTAGTSAAYYLNHEGIDVALLEFNDGFGKGLYGVNGYFAVESAYMKSLHHRETKREIFRKLMEHANWTIDAKQVSEFVSRSASVYDLLYALGSRTEELISYNLGAPYTWHYLDHDKPMFEAIGTAYLNEGGRLYRNVIMTQILRENNVVCGLLAKDAVTGEEITVSAKAVVLACGEAGEVMGGKDSRTGDVFAMAAAVGAQLTPAMISVNASTPGGMPAPGEVRPNFLYFTQPEMLAINRDGVRFTDEEILHAMEDGANIVLAQPGKKAYVIFDDQINRHFLKNGFTTYKYKMPGVQGPDADLKETFRKCITPGYVTSDCIEGIAEGLGLDPEALKLAVKKYNELAKAGRDDEFFKNADYMIPLEGPNYYAAELTGMAEHYNGVVKATASCRVLDQDDNPIPGLYAAGGTCSTLNGPYYTHMCAGSRATFGVVCGQILGEILPEDLKAL